MKHVLNQKSETNGFPPSAQAIVYGLVACLAAWLFVLTPGQVGKPVTLFGAPPEGLAPDVMPRLVLLAIALIAAYGAVTSFREKADSIELPGLRVLITCGASFVFAIILVPFGFVLASAMTVVLLAIFLGGRHLIALALSGVLVPLTIYLIFTRVLHISLPSGLVGF